MKLLVQFPTYARREKFLSCFEQYVKLSSGKHDLYFNINCDVDDSTMVDIIADPIMHEYRKEEYRHIGLDVNYDKDTNKISAINSHINTKVFDFDIVICASDDMIPQVEGWDDEIASAMIENFPNLDGCVSFHDGYVEGDLITFSILGRLLYGAFGYIYHPDYKSLYCDNEFTQEMKRLNKVVYIDKMIVKHAHYGEQGNINSGDYDQSAEKTLKYAGRDGLVFQKRKELGFPLGRITND